MAPHPRLALGPDDDDGRATGDADFWWTCRLRPGFVQVPRHGVGILLQRSELRLGRIARLLSRLRRRLQSGGPESGLRREVKDLIRAFAPRGVFYVGDGELARVCKIAHNVVLGVVIENLIEITLLAQKAGVPRHAFLEFMNNSVLGSIFTQYKTPALVNLDWATTFTPALLLKDLDLGLDASHEYGVPMPVTAAAREVVQMHMGLAQLQEEPENPIPAIAAWPVERRGGVESCRCRLPRAGLRIAGKRTFNG